jgi:hypothetical protein
MKEEIMSSMGRGKFLKIAAGTAAVTLNFLYPGMGQAAERTGARRGTKPTDAGVASDLDPTFAQGIVVSQTADGVILQAGTTTRAVRIAPGAEVWKETLGPPSLIKLNDWLDVKGTPLTDGSLQATSGWVFVNIGRQDGLLTQLSPTSLTLQDARGVSHTLEISPYLDVVKDIISVKDRSPLVGGLAALVIGSYVGAVGLRLPNGGFRATRIWS